MKNHSTINLLGVVSGTGGGVESDCRINTKNFIMTEFTTLLQQGNAWFFIPAPSYLVRFMAWNRGTQKR